MTDSSPLHAGRRLLLGALWGLGGIVAVIAGWTVVKAVQHQDVRSKRPGWLDETTAFDVAFWTPLLLTVVVGGGLVLFVFLRALRRLNDGDDLYANRYGRGVRRRGEERIETTPPGGAD